MRRPRKNLLLYCGDEITESRMRFVLETAVRATVHLLIESRSNFASAGEVFNAAVVWQTPIGEILGDALDRQGLNVVRVPPGPEWNTALVEQVKTALVGKRGPKRKTLEVAA